MRGAPRYGWPACHRCRRDGERKPSSSLRSIRRQCRQVRRSPLLGAPRIQVALARRNAAAAHLLLDIARGSWLSATSCCCRTCYAAGVATDCRCSRYARTPRMSSGDRSGMRCRTVARRGCAADSCARRSDVDRSAMMPDVHPAMVTMNSSGTANDRASCANVSIDGRVSRDPSTCVHCLWCKIASRV